MSEPEIWGFEDKSSPYVFIEYTRHPDGSLHTEFDPPDYKRRRRHPIIWVPLEDYYRLLSKIDPGLKTRGTGQNGTRRKTHYVSDEYGLHDG